jgi:hypothetical protein
VKLIGQSDRALMRFKGRLERVEEEHWRKTIEVLDRYLEGRSREDVEFFCVHGYLPEISIPGRPFAPPPMSWNERWKDWKEFQRAAAKKTTEEREFFCVNGYWPTRDKDNSNGEV